MGGDRSRLKFRVLDVDRRLGVGVGALIAWKKNIEV